MKLKAYRIFTGYKQMGTNYWSINESMSVHNIEDTLIVVVVWNTR